MVRDDNKKEEPTFAGKIKTLSYCVLFTNYIVHISIVDLCEKGQAFDVNSVPTITAPYAVRNGTSTLQGDTTVPPQLNWMSLVKTWFQVCHFHCRRYSVYIVFIFLCCFTQTDDIHQKMKGLLVERFNV